jgi:hypothetical protein
MGSWNLRWERTAWPGIYVCGDNCRVRVRLIPAAKKRRPCRSGVARGAGEGRRHARWAGCPGRLVRPGKERFTVHGLRRTFVDLARRAKVDSVVTRSLTGHVTLKTHLH